MAALAVCFLGGEEVASLEGHLNCFLGGEGERMVMASCQEASISTEGLSLCSRLLRSTFLEGVEVVMQGLP